MKASTSNPRENSVERLLGKWLSQFDHNGLDTPSSNAEQREGK
jgi:hypothetical protein